ncbi:hypothetical protein HOE04_03225 [archaeon]|jgi:hypothetical protein|nr:hypothetical protein [archaeon]
MKGKSECVKKLEELFRKRNKCEANGHPFEQNVLTPYQGGSSQVFVKCSGCEALYDRRPTSDEVEEYYNLFKLEFR